MGISGRKWSPYVRILHYPTTDFLMLKAPEISSLFEMPAGLCFFKSLWASAEVCTPCKGRYAGASSNWVHNEYDAWEADVKCRRGSTAEKGTD